VFSTLKERDILRLKGPLGSFFIREDSDKPMIFVAGGTGFAPVKGMLEHVFAAHLDRELVLYWGVRALKDLYMAELPQRWLAEHPNFSFIPVLSNPEPGDHWQGRTGFVHEAVLADFSDLSGYQVYACGAPIMVDSARDTFTQTRGLPEEEFFADSFVYAADAEPATVA
jgi:CDP-4-dehydro-6-deoxyglucose reductase